MIFAMMHARARCATALLRSSYGPFAALVAQVQQVAINIIVRIRPKWRFQGVAGTVWRDDHEFAAGAKRIENKHKY